MVADQTPTSFLPRLPRSVQTSELVIPDLLAHISVLRQLYLPPVHGGFVPSDTLYNDDDVASDDDNNGERSRHRKEKERTQRGKQRERRFSAGLSETMDSLGLGLELGLGPQPAPKGPQPIDVPGRSGFATPIPEQSEPPSRGSIHSAHGSAAPSDREDDDSSSEDEEPSAAHLDPFEREWSQKWLENIIRRSQTYLEEMQEYEDSDLDDEARARVKSFEALLRDATAALAMMAGTSAASSLTRHLLFPVDPALSPALKASQTALQANRNLSPETSRFLTSLATSPESPKTLAAMRRLSVSSATSTVPFGSSPEARTGIGSSSARRMSGQARVQAGPSQRTSDPPRQSRHRRRPPAVPVLLHDAPMGDHLAVGVQTWGSAILLGRQVALRPDDFALFRPATGRPVRVLELGAGTGLLSILCRKMLDLHFASASDAACFTSGADQGLVVATDFLPSVLDNLKVCVDLNFPTVPDDPTERTTDTSAQAGLHVVKLDWSTFPPAMERSHASGSTLTAGSHNGSEVIGEEIMRFLNEPFDLVFASDCVYDTTHAKMLREVISWVLRLPDPSIPGDEGGSFHILSPLRPTFTPELDSIDANFPLLSSYAPYGLREEAAAGTPNTPNELQGEGIGRSRGLKIGTRGEGKRGMKGRKGEGRVDEVKGYWWWQVGWG